MLSETKQKLYEMIEQIDDEATLIKVLNDLSSYFVNQELLYDSLYEKRSNYLKVWSFEHKKIYHQLVLAGQIKCN